MGGFCLSASSDMVRPIRAALVTTTSASGWAMRVNPFFSTFVRIQSERGHAVISSGPYAWVRHPGYAGTIAAHLAIPAALASTWAYIPALFGCLVFVVRTAREDRVLAERLPNYREYQARVRWRLIPGAW